MHDTGHPDPLGHADDGLTEAEEVIACLEDDAAQIRQELANCRPNGEGFICEEWADNMEKAARLLRASSNDDGKEASDRLIRAVFLDLLGQVRAFIDAEGEANFWTGPAEALRWTLEGKTPPADLQSALAKFILKQGTTGVKGDDA